MYRIAKSNTDNRRILFRNTAAKMHVHEAIVEKDFWVCLTLEYLFHQCKYNDAFAFKGGTSLSKAWHVIERFSEDIDLILDWRFLGYALKEPWKERSKKQQELFNKAVNVNAAQFIGEELAPLLKTDLSRILGVDADISVDEHDPQTINFNYPHIFVSSSLTQSIKLEIGPLAAWTPARKTLIYTIFVQHNILRSLYKIQQKSLRRSQNALSGRKPLYFIMKHIAHKILSYLPDIHDTIMIYIVLPIHMSKRKPSQILSCYTKLLSSRKNSIPVDGQNSKKPNRVLFH